jgi:cell division protein FtsI (penicillin-binding protein 3)
MKHLLTLAFFISASFAAQSTFAQNYQWGGKMISKKKYDSILHQYTVNFCKYYNSDNFKQTQSDLALIDMLMAENAESGLAVLVDLKTNAIVSKSAFSQKGKEYVIDTSLFNKAIEPGSLMLPMSAAIIMDNYSVTLNDTVDLEAGQTIIEGRRILDAEQHSTRVTNLKTVIAESSNVGIAKLVYNNFKEHGYQLNFNDIIYDYVGASVITPNETTLTSQIPFKAFGYGILLTPNQIFNFYKRVAQSDPTLFKNATTLTQVQSALVEVCNNGTAKKLFMGSPYIFAGKTGTVLVADAKKGYAKNQFQPEFIGYDNPNSPNYACMVIIRCKPNSPNHFGASVAGPVFKFIMDDVLKK